MSEPVAVIGCSWFSVGPAVAADLALCGHDVRFAGFPDEEEVLRAAIAARGFVVEGSALGLVAGRLGFARPTLIGTDVERAVAGAGVVILDCLVPDLIRRAETLIPALARDALLYVQSLGYWPAARLQALLRRAGREDVLVAEASVATHAAKHVAGTVTAQVLRGDVAVAAWPGRRSAEAAERLRPFLPAIGTAPSVLQTGLEGLNLLVHPPLILLNLGHFDRCAAAGQRVLVYGDGVTPAVADLAAALDAERGRVCAAYGVRHRTLPEALAAHYGAPATGHLEALRDCPYYRSLTAHAPEIWRFWLGTDIPFAAVPLVRLARQAGVDVPLHSGLAEMFRAVLGVPAWDQAPMLADLGLDGPPEAVMRRALFG